MHSLTSHLNNPQSPIYQWFDTKQSAAGNRLIASHNHQMSRTNLIEPKGQIKDFALLGTAFIYAFRWHLGCLQSQFNDTVASYEISEQLAVQLLQAKSSREKAAACLLFAGFEQKYRSGEDHEIVSVLLKNRQQIKPELSYINSMVDDLSNLIDSISSSWLEIGCSITNSDAYHLNPTFSGAYNLNADAQQIVGGMLIKCFTTLKRSPFNRQHFWQQIAYVLLDLNDDYQINQICWYYPRQKAVFVYPVDALIKNLPKLRQEFTDFLGDLSHSNKNAYSEEYEYQLDYLNNLNFI